MSVLAAVVTTATDGQVRQPDWEFGFDLYVLGGAAPTRLSGPLETANCNGDITLRYIP